MHRHDKECQHGSPTAVPRKGHCPVCLGDFRKEPAYCPTHFRWECKRHVREGVHHNPEKAQKAREDEWMVVTKEVQAQLSEV